MSDYLSQWKSLHWPLAPSNPFQPYIFHRYTKLDGEANTNTNGSGNDTRDDKVITTGKLGANKISWSRVGLSKSMRLHDDNETREGDLFMRHVPPHWSTLFPSIYNIERKGRKRDDIEFAKKLLKREWVISVNKVIKTTMHHEDRLKEPELTQAKRQKTEQRYKKGWKIKKFEYLLILPIFAK